MIQAMTMTAVFGPRDVDTATVRVFAPVYAGTGAAYVGTTAPGAAVADGCQCEVHA